MKNLEFDIFISYSHVINEEKDGNGEGWVDHFVKRLRNHFNIVNGTSLKPWLDNGQLVCGDTSQKIFIEGLQKSRLFVPILSPPYFKSHWCRKEFMEFVKLTLENPPIDRNGFSRIIPIIYYPFEDLKTEDKEEREEIDAILSSLKLKNSKEDFLLYTPFYIKKNHMPKWYASNEQAFDDACQKFATSLKEKLSESANIALGTEKKFTGLYISSTSSRLLNQRKDLVKELEVSRKYKDLSYKIMPDEGQFDHDAFEKMNFNEFKNEAKRIIDSCSLSFHRFDAVYGRTPEDSALSYLELQYDIAAAKAKKKGSKFKCYVYLEFDATDTTLDEESKKRQGDLIKKIEKDLDEHPDDIIMLNSENISETSEVLIQAIGKQCTFDPEDSSMEEQTEHLLLLLNSKDEHSEWAKKTDDYIFTEKKMEVRKPTFNNGKNSTAEAEKNLKDSLEKCTKAIIFFGENATDEWCNAVKIDIRKAANTRKKGIEKKAICITDPRVLDRIRKVRSQDFEIFNCMEPNYLQKIDKFLE